MISEILVKVLILSLTGMAFSVNAMSVDSLSVTKELKEVVIRTIAPKRILKLEEDGSTRINSDMMAEHVSFMGANDAVSLIRTLSAVRTSNDLQATLSVRGSGTGSNLFLVDGVRVINPMHMLGLYSAFNSAFYRNFTFRAGRVPVTTPSVTSGVLEAESGLEIDTVLNGTVTLGLIESHCAVRAPINKRASISIGGRTTYLNTIFPRLLTLGSSHLTYSFKDFNTALNLCLNSDDFLRISVFMNGDDMSLFNSNDSSQNGYFSWRNNVAGATWVHRDITTTIGISNYSNKFELYQGGRHIYLPSGLTQVSAHTTIPIKDFTIGANAEYRHSLGQNGFGRATTCEADISAIWHKNVLKYFDINTGLRVSEYNNGNYNILIPLPRIDVIYKIRKYNIFIAYGRYVRFDRLVEESSNGLPIDFWSCATHIIKPEETHSFELGVSGTIPNIATNFMLEGYFRRLLHSGEFTGSLLDLTNASYNPLDDLALGNGYAYGISFTAMRQIGRIRSRISYNYGHTKLRFAEFGNTYYPSVHDRPHDLNITLNWSIIKGLNLGATYTYATGTPYTQAKYGYMIGENLICEYFSHNSSRLPSYKRLDCSMTYHFNKHHSFNISVYNALANRNVLLCYTSYSIKDGIKNMKSEMKSVIPSISYTFSF
jgi:hypothetical protein